MNPKEEHELALGEILVQELNRCMGTDFRAQLDASEPGDVLLVSTSGGHESLPLQITSAGGGHAQREDNHNLLRFRKELTESLHAKGLTNCEVWATLTPQAREKRVKVECVEKLAALILAQPIQQKNATVTGTDIENFSPELRETVSTIRLRKTIAPGVKVNLPPITSWPDVKLLDAAIKRKEVNKYEPRERNKLVLLVELLSGLGLEEVEIYRENHPRESLPFKQVWVYSPFTGPVRLNPHFHFENAAATFC